MKIKYIFILATLGIASYLLIFTKDNSDDLIMVDSNKTIEKPIIMSKNKAVINS